MYDLQSIFGNMYLFFSAPTDGDSYVFTNNLSCSKDFPIVQISHGNSGNLAVKSHGKYLDLGNTCNICFAKVLVLFLKSVYIRENISLIDISRFDLFMSS